MRGCIAAAVGFLVFVGAAAAARAETRTVSVQDTPLGRELAALLSEDLGPRFVAFNSSAAQLRATLELKDTLQLVVTDTEGGLVIERSFTLEHGRSSAIRAAAVAVERAAVLTQATQVTESQQPPATSPPATDARSSSPPVAVNDPNQAPTSISPTLPPPPAPVQTEPPEADPVPTLLPPVDPTFERAAASEASVSPAATLTSSRAWTAGVEVALLWAGSAPAFGAQLSGGRRMGSFGLKAMVGVYGLGCCTASVNDGTQTALAGRVLAFDLLAGAEWVPFSFGGTEGLVSLDAGAERLQLTVEPRIFAGPSPTTSARRWIFVARVGLGARGPLLGRRVWWRAQAGLQWRAGTARVALPDGFPSTAAPLSVGAWSPLLTAGVEVILF